MAPNLPNLLLPRHRLWGLSLPSFEILAQCNKVSDIYLKGWGLESWQSMSSHDDYNIIHAAAILCNKGLLLDIIHLTNIEKITHQLINKKNMYGITPLMAVAIFCKSDGTTITEICRILLENGADPSDAACTFTNKELYVAKKSRLANNFNSMYDDDDDDDDDDNDDDLTCYMMLYQNLCDRFANISQNEYCCAEDERVFEYSLQYLLQYRINNFDEERYRVTKEQLKFLKNMMNQYMHFTKYANFQKTLENNPQVHTIFCHSLTMPLFAKVVDILPSCHHVKNIHFQFI